jgi:anti-sigma B factor antagonist
MHVTVRKSEDVVIADLKGQLHGGLGDEILRGVVNELLAEGWRKILLNLSRVHSIDSSGVGELVQSLRVCRKFGADLKLLNPHDRVKKSLHLAQLLPVFHVYEDETEALRGFAAAVGPGR